MDKYISGVDMWTRHSLDHIPTPTKHLPTGRLTRFACLALQKSKFLGGVQGVGSTYGQAKLAHRHCLPPKLCQNYRDFTILGSWTVPLEGRREGALGKAFPYPACRMVRCFACSAVGSSVGHIWA